MLDGAQGEQGAQSGGTGGLAHLLLNSYQERLIQSRLQEEQEREDCQQEEEEDDEEEDGEKGLQAVVKFLSLLPLTVLFVSMCLCLCSNCRE